MLNHFNHYYCKELLDEARDDFITWTLKAKKAYHRGPILDLGIVDAFISPPSELMSALCQASLKPGSHGYGYGHEAFEEACMNMVCGQLESPALAASIKERFGLLTTAGAKGALNVIAQAFINPGDVVLTTKPGYPVFRIQAERLGASVWELPLLPENGYLPDLSSVPSEVLAKARILLVNYPNNPTGKVLNQDEVDKISAAVVKHNILLINDATYNGLIFDEGGAGSFLRQAEISPYFMEVYSLSKSLQIPGWRLGFVLCDKRVLPMLRKLSLMQSTGQPRFLLDALASCLPQKSFVRQVNSRVSERLSCLVEALRSSGFNAHMPAGTFFCYVEAPAGIDGGPGFSNSIECARYLASELGIITLPWDVDQKRFLRFSVAFKEGDDKGFFSELKQRLGSRKFIFC